MKTQFVADDRQRPRSAAAKAASPDGRRVSDHVRQLKGQPSFLDLLPPGELAAAQAEFEAMPEVAGVPYPDRKTR